MGTGMFALWFFLLRKTTEWVKSEWDDCSDGSKTRLVRCSNNREQCPLPRPDAEQSCIGAWQEGEWGECDSNKDRYKEWTCPKGHHCPEKDGNKTTYKEKESCFREWNVPVEFDDLECSNGKKTREVTCPEGFFCKEANKPATEEICVGSWEIGEWSSECNNGYQTRDVKCMPEGAICEEYLGNTTDFVQENPCVDIDLECPESGCLTRGKIKDLDPTTWSNGKQTYYCLETGGSGESYINMVNCSADEKQVFTFDTDTLQIKSAEDRCLEVNVYDLVTSQKCNKDLYSQKFVPDGDYIRNLRDGKYIYKKGNSDGLDVSTNKVEDSRIAFTTKGIWSDGDWTECDTDGNQKRTVTCSDDSCDERNGHTSTFEESRKCYVSGIIKNIDDYTDYCAYVTGGYYPLSSGFKKCKKIDDVDTKTFTYYPNTEQIKTYQDECWEIDREDSDKVKLKTCDDTNKNQKFKMNENNYLYSSDTGNVIYNFGGPREAGFSHLHESNVNTNKDHIYRFQET